MTRDRLAHLELFDFFLRRPSDFGMPLLESGYNLVQPLDFHFPVDDAGVGVRDMRLPLGKRGSHLISLCYHIGIASQQKPYRIGPAASPPLIKKIDNSLLIGRVRKGRRRLS
jgi:hypothetical protein